MAEKVKIVNEIEQKKLWDNYRVVGEIAKSNGIKFVVGAGIRNGVRYIVIREFYIRRKDNTWLPARDGITIPIRIPVENGTKIIAPYAAFADLLAEAATLLTTMELSDDEHAVYGPRKVKKYDKN